MDAGNHCCLKWTDHQSTLAEMFSNFLSDGILTDCILSAEGQLLRAHRVVLSACSPYFELIFRQRYETQPIIFLKDVKFQEIETIVNYMYYGEVKIPQKRLSTVLKIAEFLQIKGMKSNICKIKNQQHHNENNDVTENNFQTLSSGENLRRSKSHTSLTTKRRNSFSNSTTHSQLSGQEVNNKGFVRHVKSGSCPLLVNSNSKRSNVDEFNIFSEVEDLDGQFQKSKSKHSQKPPKSRRTLYSTSKEIATEKSPDVAQIVTSVLKKISTSPNEDIRTSSIGDTNTEYTTEVPVANKEIIDIHDENEVHDLTNDDQDDMTVVTTVDKTPPSDENFVQISEQDIVSSKGKFLLTVSPANRSEANLPSVSSSMTSYKRMVSKDNQLMMDSKRWRLQVEPDYNSSVANLKDKFECQVNRMFESNFGLYDTVQGERIQDMSRDTNWECSKCGKICVQKERLAIHMKYECESLHKCPYCSYKIKDKTNMIIHIHKHHQNRYHLF